MAYTRRGIYHNLKESKYTISNGEIVYFFSSKFLLRKFMKDYREHRVVVNTKLNKLLNENPLNMDMLADIRLYEDTEKRGFRVWLKGVDITCPDLYQYALRKMTEKNTLDWLEIRKPKLSERIKSME